MTDGPPPLNPHETTQGPPPSAGPPPMPAGEPPDAEAVEEHDVEPGVGVLDQSFNCQQCGAKLKFAPGTTSQQCPYCDHNNPIPQSEEDIQELDFWTYIADTAQAEETEERLTVKCQACGAETTFDPNITARACAFCGTDIVATARSSRQIKPSSLLAFDVNRTQARTLFQQWLKKLWFAPNALKRMHAQDSGLNGIYVPYWTYDCNTTSFYRGERGTHYYVTQRYTVNGQTRTRQVRKTRWRSVRGTVWNNFDDVLVLASHSLPRRYAEALEPWDLHNLVPYAAEYLSGFRTESYQVDLNQGFEYARGIMDDEIRRTIRADIGGDEQRIHSVKTRHEDITFKHILLPIWISAYRYKGKSYRFLVNGRTGEVQGERPWSWWKITLAVLAAAALIGGIAWLGHVYG